MIFAGHRWLGLCATESVYSLGAIVVVVAMVVSWWLFTCYSKQLAIAIAIGQLFVSEVTIWLQPGWVFRRFVARITCTKCHAFNRVEITTISSAGQCNMLQCDVHSLFADHDHQRERECSLWNVPSGKIARQHKRTKRNETKWNQPTILINLFAIV